MSVEKSPLEQTWDMRLAEVGKALEGNGFDVTILENLPAAVEFFEKTMLPELKPKTVGVGGSETVTHSGVYQIIQNMPGVAFHNPYVPGLTAEEGLEIRRQGLVADLFITSTNALLRDGRLLNLDGFGNRVAALCCGPRKVVLFVGRNKIVEDMEAARQHVKEIAAVANNIRLKRKNPCVKAGTCMECKSPERICNTWVLTEKCFPKSRIHVLLINEELGY
ncbi:lactate utilization protein [Desulfovibrio sp. OttesenSCG-928-C06]|nr:lactate utilization protein [Desulfovibrio sp. OttesenSCG-928-C06]